MTYIYQYPRPAVTVDIILITSKGKLLLIQRKNPPFQNHWAFPGGFIEMEETGLTSAKRELEEETGIKINNLIPIGFADEVKRDPRGRTISLLFLGILKKELPPQAQDDAKNARWFFLNNLPPLAFDHSSILKNSLETLKILIKCQREHLKNTFQLTFSELKELDNLISPEKKTFFHSS